MDNNAFALFVLGLATMLIAIVIWQIFTIARTRMQLTQAKHSQQLTERWQREQHQLESRLSDLADDVQAIEQRLTKLEPPKQP